MPRRKTMTVRAGITGTVEIPVFTVVHATDQCAANPRPILLGETEWCGEDEAHAFARKQSARHPSPHRFTIFDPEMRPVCTYPEPPA